jgi:cytochrome b561
MTIGGDKSVFPWTSTERYGKPAIAFHWISYTLFARAGIHAQVALWHHCIRHDDVLRRMWPRPPGSRTARP